VKQRGKLKGEEDGARKVNHGRIEKHGGVFASWVLQQMKLMKENGMKGGDQTMATYSTSEGTVDFTHKDYNKIGIWEGEIGAAGT